MTPPEPRDEPALRGGAIAALLLGAAQVPLGSTMIAVAIPSINEALGKDVATTTTLLVTSYLLVNIVGQSPGGKLGDALGHSNTVRLGLALYGAAALAGLLGGSLWLLAVSRGTMALGGALLVPAMMALLRTHVPKKHHGRVFGLVGASMGLPAALGPLLGGEIVTRFGWRGIFGVSLPFIALSALLLFLSPFPRGPQKQGGSPLGVLRRFDWVGTALFTVSLGALVIGSKAEGTVRLELFGGSAAALAIFVIWELGVRDPVLDLRLFAVRGFTAGSLGVALQNFVMYGLIFELPQLFTGLHGFTARDSGRVLFVMMLGMAMSPIGGRLSDRFGARTTALIGAAPFLGGLGLLLWRIERFEAPRDAVPSLVLIGLGLGLSMSPFQSTAMTSVSADRAGMAAGATSTIRYVGGVLSVLVLGAILGEGRAGEGRTAAPISAHHAAAGVFLAVGLLAALTAALLPRTPRKPSGAPAGEGAS